MPSLATWLKLDDKSASQADKPLADRFLSYWDGLRRDRGFPLITDLNLDRMGEFVPYTFNLDISYSAENPTLRFVGPELARDCGGNAANRHLSALPRHCLVARALRNYSKVITHRKPFTVADEFVNAEGGKVFYRAVMLPFSLAGSRIDYIIGAISGKEVRSGESVNGAVRQGDASGPAGKEDARRASARTVTPPKEGVSGKIAPRTRKDAPDLVADTPKARSGTTPSSARPASGTASPRASPHPGMSGPGQKGHLIVLGSEKGGTGKSTTAMHLIVSLLYKGHTVGTIDLDSPQRTLSRYIENRRAWSLRRDLDLPTPLHLSESDHASDPKALERDLRRLLGSCDYVVVDTPGSVTPSSRMAHAWSDTLITPINDSFVDLDTIAVVDAETLEFQRPGHYAEMVAQARKQKAALSRKSSDWIVMRNRLSNLDARNKHRMADVLEKLSVALGFRTTPGLSERVIYRELFPMGLTLLDLHEKSAGVSLSMSHVAARQELRTLMDAIRPALAVEPPQPRAATG